MARIVVTDTAGNIRMERDTEAPTLINPPHGWDEARWAGKLVEDLVRQLDNEDEQIWLDSMERRAGTQ